MKAEAIVGQTEATGMMIESRLTERGFDILPDGELSFVTITATAT